MQKDEIVPNYSNYQNDRPEIKKKLFITQTDRKTGVNIKYVV